MNVNLAEHQRSILAAMGIDLWIPQVDVQTRHYQNTLYRDVAQNEAEIATTVEFKDFNHSTTALTKNTENVIVRRESAVQSEVSLLKVNAETQQTEEITSAEQIQKQTAISVEPALQIASFEIQAYQIEHCVIFVDATQLNDDQKTLWGNIQRAAFGQYFELKWPFPMLQFQDGRGASMYIQGFIDGLRQERKIISLGQLTHLNQSDVIQLASLQEMIEQPILKRRLWQFMQK
ncbi:hypothetical protein [Acinetobacter wuhouensis]|uniref:Uncharacterized protein n=1 Tax=Acinetobacter wuhouensis TaxID=1879050 RepID=A0A4Q7AHS7_9GAMM|nr:hypothetical protein [Acinetobacter wuhouensis]RZG46994.1 hypothetical protein EXU28_07335 [Acinetobacter wuhouensis]RZG71947.1 hypothetical protein EXU29_12555 [Acinetobacter wuhouensis]